MIDTAILAGRDHTHKTRQKRNYDQCHGVRELSALDYGDIVWVPDCATEAVVGEQVAPRSYELVTGRGTATRRNRQDLIKMPGNDLETDQQGNRASPENVTLPEAGAQRRSSRESHPPIRYNPSWV